MMEKLMLILILIMSCPALVLATGAGYPAPFLRMPIGIRSLGLGGANSTIAGDAEGIFYNPAQILSRYHTFSTGILQLPLDQKITYASLVTSYYLPVSVSWANYSISHIQGRDAMGNPTNEFSYSNNCFLFGTGKRLNKVIMGIIAKGIYSQLEHAVSFGYSVDVGIIIPCNPLYFGASLQNIGGKLYWETGLKEYIPYNYRIGIGLLHHKIHSLLEINKTKNEDAIITGGIEIPLIKWLLIRAGYNSLTGFSAGLTGNLRNINIHFAYSEYKLISKSVMGLGITTILN